MGNICGVRKYGRTKLFVYRRKDKQSAVKTPEDREPDFCFRPPASKAGGDRKTKRQTCAADGCYRGYGAQEKVEKRECTAAVRVSCFF